MASHARQHTSTQRGTARSQPSQAPGSRRATQRDACRSAARPKAAGTSRQRGDRRVTSQRCARTATRRAAGLMPTPRRPRAEAGGPVTSTPPHVCVCRGLQAPRQATEASPRQEDTRTKATRRVHGQKTTHTHKRTHTHGPRQNAGHRSNICMGYLIFQLMHPVATQTKAINLICTQITFLLFSPSQEREELPDRPSKPSPTAAQKPRGRGPLRTGGRGRRQEPSLANH